MDYLTLGELPQEDKEARKLVLSKSQNEVIDGVLYRAARQNPMDHSPYSRPWEAVPGSTWRCFWWTSPRRQNTQWAGQALLLPGLWSGARGASRVQPDELADKSAPPMTPIPVAGPFDKVGVDVLQLPRSYEGNQYAVVFVDYLTKWPEVFPTKDQTALTIARLLVDQIIARHGVPSDLLSDRGANFLSQLMQEVCHQMGIHKFNTTAYHPQTDGLVERFNRTLLDMLAKTVEKNGRDWDVHLPYVLFGYCASLQENTRESPFFLLYGRDPRLPTDAALCAPINRRYVEIDDYKSELVAGLSEAWELVRTHVQQAQRWQKKSYDRRSRDPLYQVGDGVFFLHAGCKDRDSPQVCPTLSWALPCAGGDPQWYSSGASGQATGHPDICGNGQSPSLSPRDPRRGGLAAEQEEISSYPKQNNSFTRWYAEGQRAISWDARSLGLGHVMDYSNCAMPIDGLWPLKNVPMLSYCS